jgi:hypothetical protein
MTHHLQEEYLKINLQFKLRRIKNTPKQQGLRRGNCLNLALFFSLVTIKFGQSNIKIWSGKLTRKRMQWDLYQSMNDINLKFYSDKVKDSIVYDISIPETSSTLSETRKHGLYRELCSQLPYIAAKDVEKQTLVLVKLAQVTWLRVCLRAYSCLWPYEYTNRRTICHRWAEPCWHWGWSCGRSTAAFSPNEHPPSHWRVTTPLLCPASRPAFAHPKLRWLILIMSIISLRSNNYKNYLLFP